MADPDKPRSDCARTAGLSASEMDLLSEAEPAQDSVAALRLLSRHFIEHLANRAGMKSRAVGVQAWAEALHTPRCCGTSGRALAKIAALIARAQKEGRLVTSVDPDALARASIALFHGFVLQKLWDPKVPLCRARRFSRCLIVVDKQKRRADAAR